MANDTKATPVSVLPTVERLVAKAASRTREEGLVDQYEVALADVLARDLKAERSEQVVFKPSEAVAHDLTQLSAAWGIPRAAVVTKLLDRLLRDSVVMRLIEESADNEGI